MACGPAKAPLGVAWWLGATPLRKPRLQLLACRSVLSSTPHCAALHCVAMRFGGPQLRVASLIAARLQKKTSGSGERTREKSLAEELAEIGMSVGEELIEFLEMGLAGLEDPAKTGKSGSSSGGASASGNSRSSSSAKPPPPPPPSARPAPPPPPPKAQQSVDDMLKQMKKDMGLE